MSDTPYRITGLFPMDCDGYNIWDYLPDGAHELRFATEREAIQYAETHSKGPDSYGIEPTWDAAEVQS